MSREKKREATDRQQAVCRIESGWEETVKAMEEKLRDP
jgi:hypothetical protein